MIEYSIYEGQTVTIRNKNFDFVESVTQHTWNIIILLIEISRITPDKACTYTTDQVCDALMKIAPGMRNFSYRELIAAASEVVADYPTNSSAYSVINDIDKILLTTADMDGSVGVVISRYHWDIAKDIVRLANPATDERFPKVRCIKLFRKISGLGLRNSKDIINAALDVLDLK